MVRITGTFDIFFCVRGFGRLVLFAGLAGVTEGATERDDVGNVMGLADVTEGAVDGGSLGVRGGGVTADVGSGTVAEVRASDVEGGIVVGLEVDRRRLGL